MTGVGATVADTQVGVKGRYSSKKGLKNTCGSGSRQTLFFSADPIIFSTRLTVRSYFLRVVAGCSYSMPKWRLLSQ